MSEANRLSWGDGGDLPWGSDEDEWDTAETEAWRGEMHLRDWPEELAGPEYWLYKKLREDEG
jgi:hypothetical protein